MEDWGKERIALGAAIPDAGFYITISAASSRYRHRAFAQRICSGELHSGSRSRRVAIRMLMPCARLVATFSRLGL